MSWRISRRNSNHWSYSKTAWFWYPRQAMTLPFPTSYTADNSWTWSITRTLFSWSIKIAITTFNFHRKRIRRNSSGFWMKNLNNMINFSSKNISKSASSALRPDKAFSVSIQCTSCRSMIMARLLPFTQGSRIFWRYRKWWWQEECGSILHFSQRSSSPSSRQRP